MFTTYRSSLIRLSLVSLITLISIAAIGLSVRGINAEAAAAPGFPSIGLTAPTVTSVVITLTAIDDVDATQRGDHNAGYPNSYLVLSKDGAGHYDNNYALFDLSALPANATVNSAEFHLNVSIFGGPPLALEMARVDSAWDETTVTWNNQPTVTVGGVTATVNMTGDLSWPVTALVQAWQNGTRPNYGFMFRGTNSVGAAVIADSKESGPAPSLVIEYSYPTPTGARPDLGDAPDSTNHVGITNTAYPGVDGHFPTVWAGTLITQAAGPRHANLTGEGILGDFLSRENEADQGPDEDVANNILNGGANNSNNDRGDDGWRNRNANFDLCQPTTVRVRVSRAMTPTLNRMYLNVWFDGNHDGDWADELRCSPDGESPLVTSTEWIVQDYIVNMAAIAPGGFADFPVNTEYVLNTTPDKAHWLRFTLSETRTQQFNGHSDGRGPLPPNQYQFGETEDYVQRPQPPGTPGSLVLHKTVGSNSFPVEWLDTVTYKVNLRHDGGSQAIGAELRDELPYPLIVYPTIDSSGLHYVTVESEGGVSPLQAKLEVIPPQGSNPPQQVVKWRGTLDPNSEITLTFKVRVIALCQPDQQTMTFHNIAQARPITSSTNITANVSFDAKCLGYDEHNLDVSVGGLNPSPTKTLQLPNFDLNHANQLLLENTMISGYLAGFTRLLKTNLSTDTIALPGFEQITLAPHVTQTIDYPLNLSSLITDELSLPEVVTVTAGLRFCILPSDRFHDCPNSTLFPNLIGERWPLTITIRPHDLGDAPDSTNHAGAAMLAYPAVQANYPTVYDPALGVPIGPLHLNPRPFHLGQNVSREAEADLGPDEDPQNNIEPAANNPDNDRFDDGIRPDLWTLNNCQTTSVPAKVFITPQAVNYFQQLGTPAYINIWLDANRDGDWADGFICPPDAAAVEHIVIDRPVNVVALGAGLHTINVATGRVPWPAQWAQQPTWVRITLSDRPSNKPLNFGGINYGDGRGYAVPFRTGETEDYYAHPDGVAGGGPDLGVDLNGRVEHGAWQIIGPYANLPVTVTERVQFKIDYANVGSRPANNAAVIFNVPSQLQHQDLSFLTMTGIQPTTVVSTNTTITFALPTLQPGDNGTIVLGWGMYPGIVQQAETYTGTARVTVAGDIDLSNNQDTIAVTPEVPDPIIAALVSNGSVWSTADTTCRTNVNLVGRGLAGQLVNVLVDGNIAGTALIEEDGIYYFLLQNLGGGHHRIQAQYANVTLRVSSQTQPFADGLFLNVDPSLPIDPLSLTFTNSHGHIIHPRTLGISDGTSNTMMFGELTSGETYDVGVDSCSLEPNQHLQIIAVLIALLRDDDGDGRYTGSFTYNPIVQQRPTASTDPVFSVISGGVEQTYGLALTTLTPGIVRDVLTAQPLANAVIAALGAASNGSTGPIFSVWPSAALGQTNPLTTSLDGAYSFNTPGALNRVEVFRAGYQPYLSWNLSDDNGTIAQDIDLTPDVAGTPAYTITITDEGFEPAFLKAAPGSVIAWVNASLNEHTATGNIWDSGTLGVGQTYRLRLNPLGTHAYRDDANPLNTALIVVEGNRIYLPLVLR